MTVHRLLLFTDSDNIAMLTLTDSTSDCRLRRLTNCLQYRLANCLQHRLANRLKYLLGTDGQTASQLELTKNRHIKDDKNSGKTGSPNMSLPRSDGSARGPHPSAEVSEHRTIPTVMHCYGAQ